MKAITVKQPWAEAIARHGKNVENRSRRPPAHLIGQRVAIHVGQNADAFFGWQEGMSPHLATLDAWMRKTAAEAWDTPHWGDPPNAGRIIATARLVGWTAPHGLDVTAHEIENDAEGSLSRGERIKAWWANEDWRDAVTAAERSPWFTGPVGWVLADVRPLAVPVGQTQDCAVCPNRDGHAPEPRGYCLCSAPIRGQVYPFALAPEIVAAIALGRDR